MVKRTTIRRTPSGLPVEQVTQGLPVIDTNHAILHAGSAFSFALSASLSAGATTHVAMVIPLDAYVHFQAAELATNGAITMSLIEGITSYTGGSAITPVNRNRIARDKKTAERVASVLTFASGVTPNLGSAITLDTLRIFNAVSAGARIGVSGGDHAEWVLQPGTTYLFSISNPGAQSAEFSLRPFWYEEGSGGI